MSIKAGGINASLNNAEGVAIVVALVVVAYVVAEAVGLIKKTGAAAGAAATTLGTSILNTPGMASSSSNLNAGTPYAGTGPVGALGSLFNSLSGGSLAKIGGNLGSSLYDFFNPTQNQAATVGALSQGTNRDQVVTPNYIDDLSGAVGGSADSSSSLDSSYNFGLGGSDGLDGTGGGDWT